MDNDKILTYFGGAFALVVMLVFSFFANIFNIAVMGQDIKYLELISKEPYANDMERRNGKFAR